MKLQLILHRNDCYGFHHMCRRSSGLWNSCQFVAHALRRRGHTVDITEVDDNNSIDREVTRFKPDAVIIQALWVVPEKFPILKKLHPKVKWFIHLHSHTPFLALEGIAMEWLAGYWAQGLGLIANSEELFDALKPIYPGDNLQYLPNIYTWDNRLPRPDREGPFLNVGCFGAIRPLKNPLTQALAALKFAQEENRMLNFHINSTRVETGGEPILKNLRSLFAMQPYANLVEWDWLELPEFIHQLHHKIDIGMQVSLSETFSIVSANYVSAGIPMVVSKEVAWASWFNKAADNDVDHMVSVMRRVHRSELLVRWNRHLLAKHTHKAIRMWDHFCRDL